MPQIHIFLVDFLHNVNNSNKIKDNKWLS